MKTCEICKKYLSLNNFSLNKTRCDGHEYVCRVCNRIRSRKYFYKKADYYQQNKERIKAMQRERSKNFTPSYWKKKYQQEKERIRTYRKTHRHVVNALAAKRRAVIKMATPEWANFERIKLIYEKAQIYNFVFPDQAPWHVDHIIPLQNKKVQGLHVHENLQLLPAKINRMKRNKVLL